MDVFSEILRGVVLKGALYFNAEFSAPWGFNTPPAEELAQLLAQDAPHLVIYHFVVEGSGLSHSALPTESARSSHSSGLRDSRTDPKPSLSPAIRSLRQLSA